MSDSEVEIIGEISWAQRDAAKRKHAVELEPETPNEGMLRELNSRAAVAQKRAAGDSARLAQIEKASAALKTAAASHSEAAAAAKDAEQIAEVKATEAARAKAEADSAAQAAEEARSRAQAAEIAERTAAKAFSFCTKSSNSLLEDAVLGTASAGSVIRPGLRRLIAGRFIMVSRKEKAEIEALMKEAQVLRKEARVVCDLVSRLLA